MGTETRRPPDRNGGTDAEASQGHASGSGPRPVRVSVQGRGKGPAIVRLIVPPGWKVSPATAPVDLVGGGQKTDAVFSVTPPEVPGEGSLLRAEAAFEGRTYDRSLRTIDHDHIPVRVLTLPADAASGTPR